MKLFVGFMCGVSMLLTAVATTLVYSYQMHRPASMAEMERVIQQSSNKQCVIDRVNTFVFNGDPVPYFVIKHFDKICAEKPAEVPQPRQIRA